jgi:tRNA G18 (ribose-2'-O)-methylase SpoU
MSFTQKKFECLAPLNQKKKFAYAIREYLDGRQPLCYVSDMLEWYCHSVECDISLPKDNRDWQILHEKLIQEIETIGQYNNIRLFDDIADKTGEGIIVLDNIRAPYNVGGIMRSAEAFHAAKVVMCGITPTAENTKVIRSAMNVPIETYYFDDTMGAIRHYKELGYFIIAIEKTKTSKNIEHITNLPPVSQRVLVMGNEEFGIAENVLSAADIVTHIPLTGSKNSLNVCTAAGIAMFCLLKNP